MLVHSVSLSRRLRLVAPAIWRRLAAVHLVALLNAFDSRRFCSAKAAHILST
jgi:hypothetical protein